MQENAVFRLLNMKMSCFSQFYIKLNWICLACGLKEFGLQRLKDFAWKPESRRFKSPNGPRTDWCSKQQLKDQVLCWLYSAFSSITVHHKKHNLCGIFSTVSSWYCSQPFSPEQKLVEKCLWALPHPSVGERGVAVLRVELQSDEGHLGGDPGHHDLHRLVLRDAHVLEGSRQEDHTVCSREGGPVSHMMWFHLMTAVCCL